MPKTEIRRSGLMIFAENLFKDPTKTKEEKDYFVNLLQKTAKTDDCEAKTTLAWLAVLGYIKPAAEDSFEYAARLLCEAADDGDLYARSLLNSLLGLRYKKVTDKIGSGAYSGPLKDFFGKIIKIKRTGLRTPVDAELTYDEKEGINVLRLSANISFIDVGTDVPDEEKFKETVLSGFRLWEGEYEVFNNQKVRVEMNLTSESKILDTVFVVPCTKELFETTGEIMGNALGESYRKKLETIGNEHRSFAATIKKWSVYSRKLIYIFSKDDSFKDYGEIMHVAKHEFGHTLGLGDLYRSPKDNLPGVSVGTYPELDPFIIVDKYYYQVMCDHHAPVSNNDIEMVILAFRDNEAQGFQQSQLTKKISEALGKGN